MKDFFIVNSDYQKSDFEPSRYSMIIAAASLMSELQIINDLDNESKISFLEMFVTNLPDTDSMKEIIIPNLKKDQDAYFFIAPYTSKDGTFMYQIETNIPISSITDEDLRSYYKLELDRNYFIREIPARWVGVMFLEINKDKIFYQGVSYPNFCSPLVVHGDGIGPDKYLQKLLDQNTDIDKITDELIDVTNQLFEAHANETDEKKVESMNRLRKYANISFAYYSFLQGKIEESKKYLDKSNEVKLNTDAGPRIINLTEVETNAIEIDGVFKK